MRDMFRQVHAWLAWAVVAAIVVQVLLAGLAVPQLGGSGSFVTHVDVGRLIGILFLALPITAFLAGAGRRRALQALGLFGLFVVQSILPYMDPGLSIAAALHPVNALVLFGLAFWYARVSWRERTAAAA